MLSNVLANLGFTRDDAIWVWGRIVGAATAVLAFSAMPSSAIGALLPPAAASVLCGFTTHHPNIVGVVELIAIWVLWLSGKYATSELPGKGKG